MLLSCLKIAQSQHESGNQEIFRKWGCSERAAANGFRVAKTSFTFQIHSEAYYAEEFPRIISTSHHVRPVYCGQ